ncbi:angiopoietin-related protein 2-like [Malaya genurostris]|uniref:angiopoietin-related protein 2-like n=1 Tax=Malaya genurostris TaxID=325434 RepID=UPI0026F3B461|nr:angiopoietin-related protein 2-like [Malaya genurostris]
MKLLALALFAVLLLSGISSSRADDVATEQLLGLQSSLNQIFVETSEQLEAISAQLYQLTQTLNSLDESARSDTRSLRTIESNSDLLVRHVTELTTQTDHIVLNQQYCANHEALKNMFFELQPKCVPHGGQPPSLELPTNHLYYSCKEAPKRSGVYRFEYNNSWPIDGTTTTPAYPSTTEYYTTAFEDNRPFNAFCEQSEFGGGWMVIQKRQDGSVNFNRSISDYRNGFGNVRGEYWLGLEKLNQLTRRSNYQLLILMEDFYNQKYHAWYNYFKVDSKAAGYRLRIGSFLQGTGDALSVYNNEVFVTYDMSLSYAYCARQRGGGFWHYGCYTDTNRNNLNGIYGYRNDEEQGIWWGGLPKILTSLKKVQMLIKPTS